MQEGWVALDNFDRMVVIFLIIIGILLMNIFPRKKETPKVSTVDDTTTDIKALTSFIENLPPQLKTALAEGVISVSIDWSEVTRDEDDYPTIKPRVVIKSNRAGV